MNKLFGILQKPAKWIFIICGAVLGVAFAVTKVQEIGGSGFVPVLSSILVMVVGTLLLLAAPVLLLLGKEEAAKMVFIFLLGYWLLWYVQRNYEIGSLFSSVNNGMAKVAGIFAFLVALCLTAVLVLTVLEFALKKEGLRRFSMFVMLGAVVCGFLAALFFFIMACGKNLDWKEAFRCILACFGYTFVVFFGYIHFFGAPKAQ